VVIRICLKNVPLVWTCWILARRITKSNGTVWVLESLRSYMSVFKWPTLRRQVWDRVFVVYHSKLLGKFFIRKCCINIVARAWLTKIYHWYAVTSLNKSHPRHLSESSTKTMPCDFDAIGGVKSLKTAYFVIKTRPNWINSFIKAGMHFASAFWPNIIRGLGSIKVSNPVIYWLWAFVCNVDWFVWW